jgi:carbon-monoxide dehydrogenase medium subunit
VTFMMNFEYYEPETLNEAFGLLEDEELGGRPIGGGTALMLMMKGKYLTPTRLVSLRRLGPPFFGIKFETACGIATFGAMTTFSQLEHNQDVQHHFPAVANAMKNLANVRVRNSATIGGNLSHADPHLDLPPIWAALGAEADIVSRIGSRTTKVEDLSLGYYESTLEQGELIREIRVPLRPTWKSAYAKVTTRATHDWPALGIAVSVEILNGRVCDCRLFLSAAVDRPTRLIKAEAVLRNSVIDAEILAKMGAAAAAEVDIHSDSRGSSDYKYHLLQVHLVRTIQSVASGFNNGATNDHA